MRRISRWPRGTVHYSYNYFVATILHKAAAQDQQKGWIRDMGLVIMHGPGKGGPGKTTTSLNEATALALEFLKQRLLEIFRECLSGARQDQEKQEKLEGRLVQHLISILLQEQALLSENIQPILQRNGIPAELQGPLISKIEEAQSVIEILLVEMDPQLNTSKGLGLTLEDGQSTVYDVLLNPWAGIDYVVRHSLFGVDILQARGDMYAVEITLAGGEEVRREYRLDDALRQAEGSEQYPITQQAIDKYRVVIIDPPPTLGLLTLNAMVASDKIVTVIDLGAFSLQSLDQIHGRLNIAQRLQRANKGHTVELAGILCNRYIQQAGYIDQCVAAEGSVRSEYGDLVFETIIPQNPRIFDSPTVGVPVQYNDPKSTVTKNASAAYAALAQEYIRRFQLLSGAERRK